MYINKENLREEIEHSIKLSSELTTELINLKQIKTMKDSTRIDRTDKANINKTCIRVLNMVNNIYRKFNYLERNENLGYPCQE